MFDTLLLWSEFLNTALDAIVLEVKKKFNTEDRKMIKH